jgi:hypothetical protein
MADPKPPDLEPFTVWFTDQRLSRGITSATVIYASGPDVHLTREAAVARWHERRDREVARLERRIKVLRDMEVPNAD